MNRKILLLSVFSLVLGCSVFAQKALPNGYKNFELGMSLEQTKNELLKAPELGYHGGRDVSFLPGNEKVLIETDAETGYGSSYYKRCFFQFYDDSLYIITLNLNTKKIDYYSVFTTFQKKYGEPNLIDPQKATWKNDDVTIIIEKPLTIKYIDNKISNELSRYSEIQKSGEEISREMFLDEF